MSFTHINLSHLAVCIEGSDWESVREWERENKNENKRVDVGAMLTEKLKKKRKKKWNTLLPTYSAE
jgi:hypothetical protein